MHRLAHPGTPGEGNITQEHQVRTISPRKGQYYPEKDNITQKRTILPRKGQYYPHKDNITQESQYYSGTTATNTRLTAEVAKLDQKEKLIRSGWRNGGGRKHSTGKRIYAWGKRRMKNLL